MTGVVENSRKVMVLLKTKMGIKWHRIMEQDIGIAVKSVMWMQDLLWQWGTAFRPS